MASSGSYDMASSYGTIRVSWWLNSQSVADNTSNIGWKAEATWSSGSWIYASCDVYINGSHVLSKGRYQMWGGTIASGSTTIAHNSDGTKSFSSNGTAAIYTTSNNASGSGSWSLPTIARASVPSINTYPSSTPDVNLGSVVVVHMNRASTSFTHTVSVTLNDPADGGNFTKELGTGITDNVLWNTATDKDAIYATNVGNRTNSMYSNGYVTVQTYNGSTLIGTTTTPIYFHFTNPSNEMNPLFSTFSFKDSNSATAAVTSNDQYIVQGYSTLQVTILAANKMTAQKSATPNYYRYQIGSIDITQTYDTADIIKELGTVGLNADGSLVVTAVDSRGLTAAATQTIHVLPYQVPQVNASITRVNNFETSTQISVSGVVSRLTIGSTDKNVVNSASGMQYRYKKTNTETWGSWQNIASSTSSGNVSMTAFNVDLDRNFAWNVEVRITDSISSATEAVIVSVGIPIFRIGADGNVYNNENRIPNSNDFVTPPSDTSKGVTTTEIKRLFPNYSNRVGAGSGTASYTAPSDGWISYDLVCSTQATGNWIGIAIDNILVASLVWAGTPQNYNLQDRKLIPVRAGAVVTIPSSGSGNSVEDRYFIPY